MFEYTDTEFRFIEYYKQKGTLPLDSQDFNRLYKHVVNHKYRIHCNQNENPENKSLFETDIVTQTIDFLEQILPEYYENNHINSTNRERLELIYEPILDSLYVKKVRLEKRNPQLATTNNLKWIGKANDFALLISKLVYADHIELPSDKYGKENISELARQCLNSFDFEGKKPTKEYIRKQLSKSSSSKAFQDNLRIPRP